MLSGTEADILYSVARLREATKHQIRREVGFSLEYIDFLCRYLVRRGYLTLTKGHYSLSKGRINPAPSERCGIKIPLIDQTTKINPVPACRSGVDRKLFEGVVVETLNDVEFPIKDESLALESNINKIGPNLEREKSDIDESVKLFKEIQKKEVRRDE